jgi:CHAT domain-containing protein
VRLGTLLFTPIQHLLKDNDLLLLAPHGPLNNFPLHAATIGNKRVIENWCVAYVPSAYLLCALTVSEAFVPSDPVVIGAFFTEEAKAVANIVKADFTLIDQSLDKDVVLKALKRADFAHISAHGFFSDRDPELSGFIVKPSTALEKYLEMRTAKVWEMNHGQRTIMNATAEAAHAAIVTATDLRQLEFGPSFLTLSACSSGVVATDPSDDPSGFVPALIAKGAKGILASLWLVDAEATGEFMQAFYIELGGNYLHWQRKPEALRVSVLELIREGRGSYEWAPFLLLGGIAFGDGRYA